MRNTWYIDVLFIQKWGSYQTHILNNFKYNMYVLTPKHISVVRDLPEDARCGDHADTCAQTVAVLSF